MNRATRPFVVLGFSSTHDALDAETLLGDLGLDVIPIPAPKAVGSLCGIALRIEPSDEVRAVRYLDGAGITLAARADIEDI